MENEINIEKETTCPLCGEFKLLENKTCSSNTCQMEYLGVTHEELAYEKYHQDEDDWY